MYADENEKSFGSRDINTGFNDRSYPTRRGILSRHDREDESLLTETLLNPRSASTSTIALEAER